MAMEAEIVEISRHLKTILGKLESLEDTVTAIDASIKGDEGRGVRGMKQHVESLNRSFGEHMREDERQFDEVKANQMKVKYWVMGAAFVLTGAASLIAWFLK